MPRLYGHNVYDVRLNMYTPHHIKIIVYGSY